MKTNRVRSHRRSNPAALGVALVVLLVWGGVASGAGGDLVWSDRFDTGRQEGATAIAANANRVFAAGMTQNATDNDLLVRAYDARTGALLWENREDGGAFEQAVAIASVGGKVFAAGISSVPPFPFHNAALLRAYDATSGVILWEDLVDDAELSTGFNAIAAHGPRVFASGSEVLAGGVGAGLLRAYNAGNGDLLWQATVSPRATLGAVTALGASVFVAGATINSSSIFEFLVRAYDARTGELRWESDQADGIAVAITTSGGRVIVAGGLANGSGNFDPVVRVYDATSGDLLWENRQAAGDFGGILRSVTTRGGRVFSAGSVVNFATNEDILVRAYDVRTGSMLWESQHDGGDSDDEGANSVAVTGSRVAVAGSVRVAGTEQFFVRAYDVRTGAAAWEDTQGGADGFATAAVALGDRFFAAGVSTEATQDFVVRAYEAR